MSNSLNQNAVSPEQLAANRANAAKSTGPTSAEGQARSAQNARKHGFAAASYTAAGLEDTQDLANLKDDAVDFYQPANSQELFAVERIALAQLAVLRAARLEAGILSASLGQTTPDLFAGQIAANSNALSLSIRYSAHAERQYRRAVEDFDRLKALREEIPNQANPRAAAPGETKPISKKPSDRDMFEYLDRLLAPPPMPRSPFAPPRDASGAGTRL